MRDYYNDLSKSGRLYQACLNKFLILLIEEDWQNNQLIRNALSVLGKQHMVDSILVLEGNPWRANIQGYHCSMSVYEPRADSISVMCGNGIRAVCQYWIDNGFFPEETFRIKTESGIREVIVVKDSLFKVDMGLFSLAINDLKEYVNIQKMVFPKKGEFNNFSFSPEINKILNDFDIEKIIIGVTGDEKNGMVHGEPHLVFFLKAFGQNSLESVRDQAQQLGKIFTKRKELFPLEINTSAAVENSSGGLFICTYERGVYYVTKSCGSASSVAGAYFLNGQRNKNLLIETLGGTLQVEMDFRNHVFLTGNAKVIS